MQPRLLYLARLSIKTEGKIRTFADKRRLKEYISTKLSLQDLLKRLLLKKRQERSEREKNTGIKGENEQIPINNKLKF